MASDSGQYTVLVLLDLTAAFDTVDHKILINRMRDTFGISGTVLHWSLSYLTDRGFCVSINQIKSDVQGLSCGVPQGSVLGHILFLLFLTPLGQIISQFSNISHHFYTDDI